MSNADPGTTSAPPTPPRERGDRQNQRRSRRAQEDRLRRQGLPLVLPPWVRRSGLLRRSAPALYTVAVILAAMVVMDRLVGDKLDDPDESVVIAGAILTLLLLAAPLMVGVLTALLGRLLKRSPGWVQTVAGVGAVVTVFALPTILEGTLNTARGALASLLSSLVVVAIVLWLTYLGIGAIGGWAVRRVIHELGAMWPMAARALPLLVITTLFIFFNAEIWQVAANISRGRVWAIVAALAVLTAILVFFTVGQDVKQLLEDSEAQGDHRLAKAERINLVLIPVAAQLIQTVIFSALVFGFFVTFGSFAVTPAVVKAWVGAAPTPGVIWGIEVPVSNELLGVSYILSGLSALSFAASASNDPAYQTEFRSPILDELRASLAARESYLASTPGGMDRPRHE